MDFSITDFMTRFDTSVSTSPEFSLGVTNTLIIIKPNHTSTGTLSIGDAVSIWLLKCGVSVTLITSLGVLVPVWIRRWADTSKGFSYNSTVSD